MNAMNIPHSYRRPLATVLCGAALATPAHAIDLLQAYRLAIQNDARYQAARADAAASREAEPQALSQLLPNFNANLQRSDNSADITSRNILGHPVTNRQDYISSNYAVSVRQPLYRRFNFVALEQAKFQVASAEANLDRNLQDLLTRVSGAYFDALMADETLGQVLVQKEAYAAQLKSSQRRFEAGQGTRTDIDDAQTRYDMILAQELEARQNVDYSRRQLQLITNQPVHQLAVLTPAHLQLVEPQPVRPEEWVQRGEDVNPELKALRANIQAAEQEVAKANAGHHPTVDLVAQRSRQQSASENTINQGYLTTSVGLQVTIPLFAGGYYTSQARQAEAALDKARQQYEARRREIDLAIRKEHQGVAQGVLKVKALEQAERSADQAVYSNQKGFQAGTRTVVDILNAQQQRMNTPRDLANARYQYIMARIRLLSLAGSLSEEEISAINAWLDKSGRDPEQPQPDTAGEPIREQTPPSTAAATQPSVLLLQSQRRFERRHVVLPFHVTARNCGNDAPSPFAVSGVPALRFPLIERCVGTTI